MSQIYVNGGIVPESAARISVTDRSYLFGEGVFESFRSFGGKIPLLQQHLNRLEWSATFLNLPYPKDVDFAEVCEELLERNIIKDARFKIILSVTGKDIPDATPSAANLVVFCDAVPEQKTASYRLKTARTFVNDAPPVSTLKTTNRLVKIQSANPVRLIRDDGANKKGRAP